MDFVDTSVPYQPLVNIQTDQLKRVDYLKKILLRIGIGIAVISILAILISTLIYLFLRKQSFPPPPITDYTTIILRNFSTTTTTGSSRVIAGKIFGDTSGSAFDDSLMEGFTSYYYVRKIISKRDYYSMNWIQCFYSTDSDPDSLIQGGIHGIRESTDVGEEFFLDKNEKISKIQIKVNYVQLYQSGIPSEKIKLIIAIRFFTTNGRSSSNIDQVNGNNYIEEYPGYTLGYITGRAGRFINQLQFYWYQTIF